MWKTNAARRPAWKPPLLQPGVRYVFGGHVHHQTLYYKGSGRGLMAFKPTPGFAIPTPGHRQWIATVGSVGQPRDGKPNRHVRAV